MSDGLTDRTNAAWVAAVSALGAISTLGAEFIYIFGGITNTTGALDRWQALGMLAVAVGIAFAVGAMLRFALAPLLAPKSIAGAATANADAALRGRIAPIVLSIGSIAIVALAVALIISFVVLTLRPEFSELRSKVDTLLTGVFSTVLPVVATWVGTVLAFYFGSENFRQAAQSTRDVLSDRLAPKKKISDVMIPYERIAQLGAESEDAAAKLSILTVIHTMSEAATRVIVFNTKTKTPIYVIRSWKMPEKWITADYGEGPDAKDRTIKDYLDADGGKNKTDAQSFRFMDENATPEAALALMTKEGVDDLFITKDGQATSRVLGWVAAHDLLKK